MSNSGKILVAGLGSAHGDDQAGWLVAETVGEQFRSHPDVVVRRAMIPLDVLDWLESVNILHICDACETTQRHEKLQRFIWNAGQLFHSDKADDSDVNAALKLRRGRGSHDFGLFDVLRLAEKTGMLPKTVILWAIAGNSFQPEDVLSDETRDTVVEAVHGLVTELRLSHA